jgi:hypothetical protein
MKFTFHLKGREYAIDVFAPDGATVVTQNPIRYPGVGDPSVPAIRVRHDDKDLFVAPISELIAYTMTER